MPPSIRPCTDADLPAITAIYAHHVSHGTGTFEEAPPALAEMTARRARIMAEGMPYFVAESAGAVVGYAYASVYRGRSAYRFTVEDSIYVHHAHARSGVGSALLALLIETCEHLGCRQMVAVISDPAKTGSVPLHERFGFQHAGTLVAVGWKFGRWIDTVRMQRPLGVGASTPPA